MFCFRNIIVRPIDETIDLRILYNWRCKNDWNLVYYSKNIPSWEEFLIEYKNQRDNWKFIQLVICKKDDNIPLGIAYLHDINLFNRNGFLDVYIEENFRRTLLFVILVSFLLIYAFEKLNLYKIYFETLDFNINSLKILNHKNWINEEGFFKEHLLFNGKLVNVKRFSIFRDKLENLKKLIRYDNLE